MRDVSLLCIRKALPDYLRLGENTLIICLMWCPGDLLKVNKVSRCFFFLMEYLPLALMVLVVEIAIAQRESRVTVILSV